MTTLMKWESKGSAVIDYGLEGQFNSLFDCSISPSYQNCCGAHVASYLMDEVVTLCRQSGRSMKLTTHLHLESTLKILCLYLSTVFTTRLLSTGAFNIYSK
jgi:hypothetical protein